MSQFMSPEPTPDEALGSGDAASDRPPRAIEQLVSKFGVVSGVHRIATPRGLAGLANYIAVCGGGAPGFPRSHGRTGNTGDGFGRALDGERARLVAIAESAERYAASDFLGESLVWARPDELRGPMLDPRRFPRCSSREYQNPDCPVRPFDPHAAIRWVYGTDLASGRRTWVPAVMACYLLREMRREEGFANRISTGYAVHSDPAEALVRGICEVVERDAVSVAWLQKLPLPLIAEDTTSDRVEYFTSWSAQHFVENYLFDATTDVGLPTVFCIQVAAFDARAHHTAGCGTGRTITEAVEKALLEATTVRSIYSVEADPLPETFADFVMPDHGARFMGAVDRADAFDFLLKGAAGRPRRRQAPWPADPVAMLDRLVDTLTGLDMQVVAVDRTPRELAAVGLTAVSVIIPDLQPLSLAPLAQFRAHPRLAHLPIAMGYPSLTEEEQNWWPHPLA